MTPPFGPIYGSPAGGVNAQTGSYAAQASDAGRLIWFNSDSDAELSLPNPPLSSVWVAFVQNAGIGTITISAGALDLDGLPDTLDILQDEGVAIWTDGTNYFTFRGIGS